MHESLVYVDRKNTNSLKWDCLEGTFGDTNLTAMWVADMDFRAPECVLQAQRDYIETGAEGYYRPSDGYYDSFIDWTKEHFSQTLKREQILYSPGVVAAFNWCVQCFTEPGDAVIVLTPVYYPFFGAARDNDRKLIMSELVVKNGRYTVDLEKFERDIVENNVKAFLLCSPHNPIGRVWEKDELKGMLDICKQHGVYIFSDEIHRDIVFAPAKHIPSAMIGDYDDLLITLTAPSKTFNLAACQNSFVIIPNENLRKRFQSYTERLCVTSGTPFGYVAAEAAYRGGKEWLSEVLDVIYKNYLYVRNTFAKRLPLVKIVPLEGTYLPLIDFSAYLKPEEVHDFMQKKCRLAFDYGEWFGGEGYRCCVRMNLATSLEIVKDAVERICTNLNA